MTHEKTRDFCAGERKEHCGCMRLSICVSLTEKNIINCEKTLPNANKGHLMTSRGLEIAEYFDGSWQICDKVHECYNAYRKNPSIENITTLCKEVWKHINPDIKEFVQAYQQYISKNDVSELLDKLQVTNATSDDECGECEDAEKGSVDVHTIVIRRL